MGETFDDGSLANSGLTDEHRVIFGTTRKNLHDALHLALATNDRVELFVARQLGEVAAKLIKNLAATFFTRCFFGTDRFTFTFAAGTFVSAQKLNDLLANTRQVGSQFDEHLGSDAFALANEPKEDVFGTDVVVPQLQGLAQRQLEHFFGARGEWNVPGRR